MIRNSRYNTGRSRTRTGVDSVSSRDQKNRHGPEPRVSKISSKNKKVEKDLPQKQENDQSSNIDNVAIVDKVDSKPSDNPLPTPNKETSSKSSPQEVQKENSQDKKDEKKPLTDLEQRLNKLKERLRTSHSSDSEISSDDSSSHSSSDSDSDSDSDSYDLKGGKFKDLGSYSASSSDSDSDSDKYSKNSSKKQDLPVNPKLERRSRDKTDSVRSESPERQIDRKSKSLTTSNRPIMARATTQLQKNKDYSPERKQPTRSQISDDEYQSDEEELSAFDEVPRAAFLKLIKIGGASSVAGDAATEIRDIMQDFIENMFEILMEKSSSIDVRDVKNFSDNYIYDEEEMPRELVIRSSDFERALGKICEKFKARVRRDSIFVIQTLAEAVSHKIVKAGLMVASQCRQQRLSDQHLATAYKIYML
jgi:hypothetical protein